MGTTNFSALQVGGVPTQGMGGAPFLTGNWYFVDAVSGADGNPGTADLPMASITAAYNRCVEGKNDVVAIVSRPTTVGATLGTQRLSTSLTWAKSATHLIGVGAPTMIGQRARISTATGATANLAPLMTVSAQGCIFSNFSIFQGVGEAATDEKLIDITGQRNYFHNVNFQGIGSAAGAARAGSYNIYLNGGSENTFDGCTIGVDTVTRTAANASVKFRSAATRNVFKNCLFPLMSTGGTALFVDANAVGSVDRFAWFKDCTFLNGGINSSGAVVAAVAAFNAAQGGTLLFDNCSAVGCTDWTATDTATVKITGAVPNGDTSGMAASSDAT